MFWNSQELCFYFQLKKLETFASQDVTFVKVEFRSPGLREHISDYKHEKIQLECLKIVNCELFQFKECSSNV